MNKNKASEESKRESLSRILKRVINRVQSLLDRLFEGKSLADIGAIFLFLWNILLAAGFLLYIKYKLRLSDYFPSFEDILDADNWAKFLTNNGGTVSLLKFQSPVPRNFE